jgi:N-methylhydantoinase A/oxoprolinase/acetone carboxylase beta subunit
VSAYIGVDVGGTNTDAAAISTVDRSVLAEIKSPTTSDVASGVVNAIQGLLDSGAVEPADVDAVMIGTTHFVNALVSARELQPTAVVRVCGPATRSLPPLVDWPDALSRLVGAQVHLVSGGVEFDGRPIADLDFEELDRVAEQIAGAGLTTAAITAVFSPLDTELEATVAEHLTGKVPGLRCSLSSQLGRIGLLERENATIINACLRSLADGVVSGFERSVAELGIDAPLYLSQNDGTLMDSEFTNRYPVATFASGPTNSMRGAAFLSEEPDAAVVDIGGTTSDIGMLKQGFPREAASAVRVAGVRTNFRMPDVISIGIGGGSIVHADDGRVTVGPDSVGYRITTDGMVFGGSTLTATDVAVAAGLVEIGDPSLVAGVDRGLAADAVAWMRHEVGEALDRMKTGPDAVSVVLVGGGSVILGGEVPGASRVVLPPHHGVANAVGSAIAQVGGQVDRVAALADTTREAVIAEARAEAIGNVVAAGGDPATAQIVDIEEVPLAYLPSNSVRIKVKAVADLDRSAGAARESNPAEEARP